MEDDMLSNHLCMRLWRALWGKSERAKLAEELLKEHDKEAVRPRAEIARHVSAANRLVSGLQRDITQWPH